MFHIRNFGNDVICGDVEELKRSIARYAGNSVSVVDMRLGGTIHYLDVSAAGTVSESYGRCRPVDLQALVETPALMSHSGSRALD